MPGGRGRRRESAPMSVHLTASQHDTRQTAPRLQPRGAGARAREKPGRPIPTGGAIPMRRSVVAVALALSLALASAAQAAPSTWTIDPNHSQVGFSIRHFFSKVPGTFTKYSGKIVYDPEKPAASTVKAEIVAASINTNNE